MISSRLASLRAPSAFLLSSAAIVVVFWGFLHLDLPLAMFVRSLHVPWLERLGDAAHLLGKGEVLAAGTLLLFGLGWYRGHPLWRRAGLEGFLAQIVVGIQVQLLKHLIGRPRPRMMHAGRFEFGPSWDKDFDSFPSGHTSASFAVATVLARHFPRVGWLFFVGATLVGLSRVVRGSHFPTDVLAGVIVGVVTGTVIVNPLRDWRRSITQGLAHLAPYLVLGFGLFWTGLRVAPAGWVNLSMMAAGITLMLLGGALRVYRARSVLSSAVSLPAMTAGSLPSAVNGFEKILIVTGLALTTGSLLITLLAAFVMAGHWLLGLERSTSPEISSRSASYHPATEVGLAIALVAAVVIIQTLKGFLPLLY